MSRNDPYIAVLGCVAGIVLGFVGGVFVCAEGKYFQSYESLCTQNGDQGRAFAQECEAKGGELRVHEYTCTWRNENDQP